MQSKRTEATNFIGEIISFYCNNNYHDLVVTCIKLTKHLFDNQYLLYTDLINFVESSDLLPSLIKSLDRLDEQQKRDVLRLIHLLCHVSKVLRHAGRQQEQFQTFLRSHLDQDDCWTNAPKYKHHINIASLLLSDKDVAPCPFNTVTVRKLVLKKITSRTQENEHLFPCIVFYACAMFTSTFEEIPTNEDEQLAAEKILSKEVTARCLDILRDYVQDFKLFYVTDNDTNRSQYVLYKAKSEFSFQQISTTIIYYSFLSQQLRMNIYQSGLYVIINSLLSLQDIAEEMIHYALDILRLPLLDAEILNKVKNEFLNTINSKLNYHLNKETLSAKIKLTISHIMKAYEVNTPSRADKETTGNPVITSINIPSGEFVKPRSNTEDKSTNFNSNQFCSRNAVYFDDWRPADVRKWLNENNLEDLRELFTYMAGGGLKQLQFLARQPDKLKFLEFLMSTLRIRFDLSLELISALEKL